MSWLDGKTGCPAIEDQATCSRWATFTDLALCEGGPLCAFSRATFIGDEGGEGTQPSGLADLACDALPPLTSDFQPSYNSEDAADMCRQAAEDEPQQQPEHRHQHQPVEPTEVAGWTSYDTSADVSTLAQQQQQQQQQPGARPSLWAAEAEAAAGATSASSPTPQGAAQARLARSTGLASEAQAAVAAAEARLEHEQQLFERLQARVRAQESTIADEERALQAEQRARQRIRAAAGGESRGNGGGAKPPLPSVLLWALCGAAALLMCLGSCWLAKALLNDRSVVPRLVPSVEPAAELSLAKGGGSADLQWLSEVHRHSQRPSEQVRSFAWEPPSVV